ncbi:MAG: TonB-dependent receptor plug domain-containing protein [Paludibacteraceae bacterium]|nr:TonB-dependent receptor plug domain-containing protein [Paludibacteraceae bacterium]
MSRYSLLLACLALGLTCYGQSEQQNDTTIEAYRDLEELQVKAKLLTPAMERVSSSSLTLNVKELQSLPKLMGQTDPLYFLQTLAGVQVNNESVGGIFVQGCDNAHTMLTINDAPVYYPSHVLNLFSAFNASHIERIDVVMSAHGAADANRLGGAVRLQTYRKAQRKFNMSVNAGLLCSDVHLQSHVSDRSDLFVSGRASYFSLYRGLLKRDNIEPDYNFQDLNLTYSCRPTDKDDIVFSAFAGNDKLTADDSRNGLKLFDISWQNLASSLQWDRREGKVACHTSAFLSGYHNRFGLDLQEALGLLGNSATGAVGVRHNTCIGLGQEMSLDVGGEYTATRYSPLAFAVSGDFAMGVKSVTQSVKYTHEASVFADFGHKVNRFFNYSVGLRATVYGCGKVFGALDPRVNMTFEVAKEQYLYVHAGSYSQYNHNINLISTGLPTDFYIPASELFKPGYALSASLGYKGAFARNRYVVSAEVYFKRLYNSLECNINVLDLLYNNALYTDFIYSGTGRNYGLDITLQKAKGRLSGYLAYSLGWAKRFIPEVSDKPFDSSHSRRHQLVATATYSFDRSWSVGAVFTLATGTPYTRPEAAYLLNGQVVALMGAFNGERLPLTHRLDLSANYVLFLKNDRSIDFNLSLYNVYCHKNVQFVTYSTQHFNTREIGLLSMIIPSVSVRFNI